MINGTGEGHGNFTVIETLGDNLDRFRGEIEETRRRKRDGIPSKHGSPATDFSREDEIPNSRLDHLLSEIKGLREEGGIGFDRDLLHALADHGTVGAVESPVQLGGTRLDVIRDDMPMNFAHGGGAGVAAPVHALATRDVRGEKQRGKESTRLMMESLPASAEIKAAPGSHGPAVVDLPVEGTHAARHDPPEMLDAEAHAVGLIQLGEVGEGIVILREAVELTDVMEDGRVATAVFLVGLEGGTEDVEILRIAEGRGDLGMGKGLHAELGAEAVEMLLVGFHRLAPVPDIPEMGVTGVLVDASLLVALRVVRGTWPVARGSVVSGDGIGKDLVEEGFERLLTFRRGLDRLRIELDLVVAAPEREGSVVMETLHLLHGLGFGGCKECLVAGIKRAGVHEILPDHQTEFVTEIVKRPMLVDATPPDADHVHVGFGCRLQRGLVVLALEPVREDVVGDPIGTLGEDRPPVDKEAETGAELIRRLIECDRAQADAALPAVEDASVAAEFQLHLIERLFPMPIRPPELGRSNLRLKAEGFRHDLAVETNAQPVLCLAVLCRQFRGKTQGNAVFSMLLGDVDMPESVPAPRMKFDRPEDAAGEIARTPVPPEIALGLADERTAAHRVAPAHFPFIKALAQSLDLRQHAPEDNLEKMLFLPVEG